MPELPELEVIREVLTHRIAGRTLADVQVIPPGGAIVIREMTQGGFEASLRGQTIDSISRRGKFLIFGFAAQDAAQRLLLAINPKLSGRLQLAKASDKRLAKTHILFTFDEALQLRYLDQKLMGQVYLTFDLMAVPDYPTLGPEPFEISLDEFRKRLKTYHGEIKGILTRGDLVAGIGNAYADEILWAAKIHPYRKRNQLTPDEVERLFREMQSTLAKSIEQVREEMQENIQLEPRGFMAVHMKTGQACPRCGARISLVGANQRITNFCRTCQPGGLIKGME